MEKRTPIQKSIVRHSLKEIDRHPFKKIHGPSHEKALNKMSDSEKVIKHHRNLASEERKKSEPYEKKFGTFEDRFNNYAKFRKSL
jgi:hypothetical protein